MSVGVNGVAMGLGGAIRRTSLVRIGAVLQAVTFVAAIWYAIYSTDLSCMGSGLVCESVCEAQTVSSIVLLTGILMRRRWLLAAAPVALWFVGVGMALSFVH
jgi:hypothetical protein